VEITQRITREDKKEEREDGQGQSSCQIVRFLDPLELPNLLEKM